MVNSSSPLHPTFSNSSSSRRFTIPFSKSSTKERKFSFVQQNNSTRIEHFVCTLWIAHPITCIKKVPKTIHTELGTCSTPSNKGLPVMRKQTFRYHPASANRWGKQKLYINNGSSRHVSFLQIKRTTSKAEPSMISSTSGWGKGSLKHRELNRLEITKQWFLHFFLKEKK